LNINHYFNKAVLCTALLLIITSNVYSKYVIDEDKLINTTAITKIEEMGLEVKQKLNINLYLYVKETLVNKTFIEYREELRKKHNNTYIILLFSNKEKKVDIITSLDLNEKFDKEEVLDPFSGTIIPLLITKPKKDAIDDRISAALFNGYADIAEKISASYDIELDSAIGSSNRNIINLMRLVLYTTIIVALVIYFRKKFARKKQ